MQVSRSALLPYSAMQMYDVVANIEDYPNFLGWCEDVSVMDREELEVVAKLKIAYGKLRFQFTTKNRNIPGESITLCLVDGPFSEFHGKWVFKPLAESACKVSIDMDFSFDTRMVPGMFGKVFEKIVATQLDAFQKRAKELYGDGYA
jgi:ribosome-associated toxin RatA of RatAB toxin-antitoxin module